MKLKEMIELDIFLFFLDKETTHLWEIDKTKILFSLEKNLSRFCYSLVRNVNKVWAWVEN